MVGQKNIPKTVKGELAKKIAKTLPPKDNAKKVSRALFPDKVTVAWK